MTTWRKLPTEVWLTIFNHVQDPRPLLQCRLACREWNPLAERAMFSSKLVLWFPKQPKKLYQHVLKNPILGRYPKEIHLQIYNIDNHLDVLAPLLMLIINQNITHITGGGIGPEIYNLLYQLAQQPPFKLCKLQRLPSPSMYTQQYYMTLRAFRDTLQHLDLNFDKIRAAGQANILYDQLEEFKSLTSLKLSRHDFGNIGELDNCLKTQHRLKKLKLLIYFITTDYVSKGQKEMLECLENMRVEKNHNLTKLSLGLQSVVETAHFDNLIDYVVYKYPKIETLKLKDLEATVDLKRMLDTVKHIPDIDIRSCVSSTLESTGFFDITQQMKSATNTIMIAYQSEDAHPQPEMAARKLLDVRNSQFEIIMPADATDVNHISLLANFATVGISELNVDLMERRIWDTYNGQSSTFSFYDVLRKAPQVQQLGYTDMTINYQKLEAGSLILNNLSALRLHNVKLEYAVLPQISNIAPNLKSLDLNTCLIVDKNGKHKKAPHISMPYTCLSSLTISLEGIDWLYDDDDHPEILHLESILDNWNIDESAFLHLTTRRDGDKQNQYFMLLTGKPALALSETEFIKYAEDSPIFRIECKLLEILSIDLGEFVVKLRLDARTGKQIGNWSCIEQMEMQLLDSNKK